MSEVNEAAEPKLYRTRATEADEWIYFYAEERELPRPAAWSVLGFRHYSSLEVEMAPASVALRPCGTRARRAVYQGVSTPMIRGTDVLGNRDPLLKTA